MWLFWGGGVQWVWIADNCMKMNFFVEKGITIEFKYWSDDSHHFNICVCLECFCGIVTIESIVITSKYHLIKMNGRWYVIKETRTAGKWTHCDYSFWPKKKYIVFIEKNGPNIFRFSPQYTFSELPYSRTETRPFLEVECLRYVITFEHSRIFWNRSQSLIYSSLTL